MSDEPKTEKRVEYTSHGYTYHILFSYTKSWCDVEVRKVDSFQIMESGCKMPFYLKRNYKTSSDITNTEADTVIYINGYIKWDGCAELNQGCQHWCGLTETFAHIDLIRFLYLKAITLMGSVYELHI